MIAGRSAGLAAVALVAAAAMSRAACLLPLVLLPPARADGVGFAAGRPAVGAAAGLAFVLALALLVPSAGFGQTLAACAVVPLVVLAFVALARRQIGGQTGDVAGATQQLTEIVVLLALAAR